jgi:hypothetical protein
MCGTKPQGVLTKTVASYTRAGRLRSDKTKFVKGHHCTTTMNYFTNQSKFNIITTLKSRKMKWEGRVARMGQMRNVRNILLGRHEEKRPLGRHRRRWKGNIRMDLRETGWEGVDWIHLTQDRDR